MMGCQRYDGDGQSGIEDGWWGGIGHAGVLKRTELLAEKIP